MACLRAESRLRTGRPSTWYTDPWFVAQFAALAATHSAHVQSAVVWSLVVHLSLPFDWTDRARWFGSGFLWL